MSGFEVSYGSALVAGVLTFLAPCILPLVPAYLSFISGSSLEDLTAKDSARKSDATHKAIISSLFFVLGLSFVFVVVMGLPATWLGGKLGNYKTELSWVGGILLIVFGLHFMGAFRIAFLNYEKRMHLDNKPAGYIGALLIGMAFGFGWTPCVGPVLSMILMQATMAEGHTGLYLMMTYSVGLGIPFIIAAAFSSHFMAFLARFRKHLGKVELALGGLLVLTGVLIITGGLVNISNWILETFPALRELS